MAMIAMATGNRPSSYYAVFVTYPPSVYNWNVRKCYLCYHFKHKPQWPDSIQLRKGPTDSNASEHRHPTGSDKGCYVLGKSPCRLHDESQTAHEDQANDRSQGWKSPFQQQRQQLLPFFLTLLESVLRHPQFLLLTCTVAGYSWSSSCLALT